MKEVNITRKFVYNGISLPCPNPGLTADQVRELYATSYPELNNAVVEGPVTKNNVSTYTFQRAAGAKGRGDMGATLRSRVEAIAHGVLMDADGAQFHQAQQEQDADLQRKLRVLTTVTTSNRAGRALNLPSAAFGLWG